MGNLWGEAVWGLLVDKRALHPIYKSVSCSNLDSRPQFNGFKCSTFFKVDPNSVK